MDAQKDTYTVADTAANDVAVFQYTSGATRQVPPGDSPSPQKRAPADAGGRLSAADIALATAFSVLQCRPGDTGLARRFLHGARRCGGSYSGKFTFGPLEGLEKFEIDNFGAAPTVYRMIKEFRFDRQL